MTIRAPIVTRYTPIYRGAALVGMVGAALTLFGNTGLKPIKQDDWPVPKVAQPVISLKTHIDPLKLSLRSQDVFFGSAGYGPDYDWPNPRGPQGLKADQLGFLDPTEIWLAGKDTFFGPPGMGPDYDYPNPRGPKGLLFDQASRNSSLFTITFAPFYLTDWQNPRGARGLAADQLGIVDASEFWMLNSQFPFSLSDWANPARPRSVGFEPPLYNVNVLSFTFAPFGQGDWPNPRSAKGLVADQLGYLDPTEFWMLNSIYPFGLEDWSNPPRIRSINFDQVSYNVNLLSVIFAPFSQDDWPNPRGRTSSVSDYFSSSKNWLVGQDQFFGPPGLGPTYDWSNPQRPRIRNEYGSVDNYKVLLFAAPPSPFYLLDWQNPRGARGLVADQLGFVDPTEYWMLNSIYPFIQNDWSNPLRSRLVYFDQLLYNVNLLSITFAPFVQSDWPNPQRLRFIADTVPSYNINQFIIFSPFAQLDWPVPKVTQPSISLKSFSTFSYTTIGQDQFFGSVGLGPVYDWSNPQRPRVRNEFGYLSPLNISINATFFASQIPFYQIDWPNPRGAKGLTADQLGLFDHLKVLNYNVNFERVATTSRENRTVTVSFENRVALTTVENRIATAPEDNE